MITNNIFGYVSRRNAKNAFEKNNINNIGGDNNAIANYYELGDYKISLVSDNKNLIDCSEDGIVVILKGVIYNKCELQMTLSEKGHSFNSNSDDEIILEAYREYGSQCFKILSGAFSIVVLDFANTKCLVARDHFGLTNIFYYESDSDFEFSTDLDNFRQCGLVDTEFNAAIMAQYMRFGYIPSPQTIYKNIYKLSPGSYLEFSNSGLNNHRYWSPLEQFHSLSNDRFTSYLEAKSVLKESLLHSIDAMMHTDKPYGFFLSSGIDSSLITSLATQISKGNIDTFTIGVDDPRYNEADISKRISRILGTNHHEFYISESDFLNTIEDIPQYYDEPYGDQSAIPCMVLAKMSVSEIGVAFGGDGGDELFCGYPHYPLLRKAQRYDLLGNVLYRTIPDSLLNKFPGSIQRVVGNRNKDTKCQMPTRSEMDLIHNSLQGEYQDPVYFVESQMSINDWIERRMLLDIETTMCDEMNQKLIGVSKCTGLEFRAPILDYNIANLSFKIPLSYKYSNNTTKRILKDIVYESIPKDILDLPKRGFNVPVGKWLKTTLKSEYLEILNESSILNQHIFNIETMKRYYELFLEGNDRYASICWNFYIFQKWAEIHKLSM